MPSISLVVPAHDEEARFGAALRRCLATLVRVTEDWELIILDDASRDRTWAIAQEIQRADPKRIRIARHKVNEGIARTFEELYRMATKEFVFLIPGDGEYPP